MAIAVLFTPDSLTAGQYAEYLERLEAVSARRPMERLSHVCYGSGEHLRVFEVWESRAAFERVWQTLRPLLQQRGIDLGEPAIDELHQMIPLPVSRRRLLEVLSTLPQGAWLYRDRGTAQRE